MTRWSLFLQTLSLLHHFLGLYYGKAGAILKYIRYIRVPESIKTVVPIVLNLTARYES